MSKYAGQTRLTIAPGKRLTRAGDLMLGRKDVNPHPEWYRGRERLLLAAKVAYEDVVRMAWERRDFNPAHETRSVNTDPLRFEEQEGML